MISNKCRSKKQGKLLMYGSIKSPVGKKTNRGGFRKGMKEKIITKLKKENT